MAADPRINNFFEILVPFLSRLLGAQIANLQNSGWESDSVEILLVAFKIFSVAGSTGIPDCLNNEAMLAEWMGALSQVLQRELDPRLAAPTNNWDESFSRENERPIKLKRVALQIAST